MTADLGTTNTWLAVLAICALVQLLGLIAAVFYVARAVRGITEAVHRASVKLDQLEAATAPLFDQMSDALSGVSDVTSRIKRAGDITGQTVSHITDLAKFRLWPVVALARATGAAFSFLSERRKSARRPAKQDQIAESQFVYEGGNANVSDIR